MKQNCIEKSKEFLPESIARQYLQVYCEALGYEPDATNVQYDASKAEAGNSINVFR